MRVEGILQLNKWERRKMRQDWMEGLCRNRFDRRYRNVKLAIARIRWDRMLAEGRA